MSLFYLFEGARHEISRKLLALNKFCDHSSRLKYYISKEKLEELESKIEDVNQTLNLIKEGITCEKRNENLSRVWIDFDRNLDYEILELNILHGERKCWDDKLLYWHYGK